MPIHKSIPQVSIRDSIAAIIAGIEANIPVMLIGDPGVGKSAIVNLVGKQLKTPVSTLIGSTCDPTDIGGLPVIRADGKGLDRIPLSIIQAVCDAPGILFLDEVATAAPAVQAAMLRGLLERVFGDRTLHIDSRVIAATNPSEQSPGGSELSAPLIGRVAMFHFKPTHEEVADYFEELGEVGSRLNEEASDFSATTRVAPDLLQIEIPKECEQGNIPWGAPRAWERAIRMLAALPEDAHPKLQLAAMAANVGQGQAIAYKGIRDMRTHLPSVEEILKDPAEALVPQDRKKQIGAVGLIRRVAERDKWAGYIYADRLIPELRAACGKQLGRRAGDGVGAESNDTSPHRKAGAIARLNILKSIPKSALGK